MAINRGWPSRANRPPLDIQWRLWYHAKPLHADLA